MGSGYDLWRDEAVSREGAGRYSSWLWEAEVAALQSRYIYTIYVSTIYYLRIYTGGGASGPPQHLRPLVHRARPHRGTRTLPGPRQIQQDVRGQE